MLIISCAWYYVRGFAHIILKRTLIARCGDPVIKGSSNKAQRG